MGCRGGCEMSEYKVKMKANVSDGFFGIFDKKFEGVEIVSADTAQEAIEIASHKIKSFLSVEDIEDEVTFSVTDVEKL